jgi:soluble lytic murein transglycosylase-like protein
MHRNLTRILGAVCLLGAASVAFAGAQRYEPLSASVRAALHHAVTDSSAPRLAFADEFDGQVWLADMSTRLARFVPDAAARRDFLTTVHYEATRAGLDPQLVLAVIHVESAFRKYAISRAGARGYMQVMPFWVRVIGDEQEDNLFSLRTNLRFGCTILRHYLDIERGDLFRALGRYNGSLGKPQYPNRVLSMLTRHWEYETASGVTSAKGEPRQTPPAPPRKM